nr:polyprotein [Rodent hepacivirus]
MNMNSQTRNLRKRAPLGRVQGGVYIVNARKRPEPGAKPKRKQRRDARRPRSVLGGADPYFGMVLSAVAPTPHYAPGDPRRRSRFLGHLIDKPLGWATDVVHHVPLVGPIVGHPCRWICKIVRAGEDAINSITGTVGMQLFVLALLSTVVHGEPTIIIHGANFSVPKVERVLDVSANHTADLRLLTNCCSQKQVQYCTKYTCLHDSGCVICEQSDGAVTCWEPSGPMVSHHPAYDGVDEFLAHHIDAVAAAIYACDLASMHELCGAVTLLASATVSWMPMHIELNETADCYLRINTPLDPGIVGFFSWLIGEAEAAVGLVTFVTKLPEAIAFAFSRSHYVTLAAIIGLALNNNMPKAIALLVLYVEAATALPLSPAVTLPYQNVFEWGSTCSPAVNPPPCPVLFPGENVTMLKCFNPPAGYAYDALIIQRRESAKWLNETATLMMKKYGGWGCVAQFANKSMACCSLRGTPCKGCSSDCSWWRKDYTYEKCGTTPFLSSACWPTFSTGQCFAQPIAVLELQQFRPMTPEWVRAEVMSPLGRALYFYVNTTLGAELPAQRWARLPFRPRLYRGYWSKVPRGMYSTYADLATGLISKDIKDENYQAYYSATGAFRVAGMTYHIVTMATLAALGARWCLMLYALLLWACNAFALPTDFLAATAASQWDDAWIRGFVFLVVVSYRKVSPLLCSSWFPALFCLWQAHFASAYSLLELQTATAVLLLTGLLLGGAASWLPRLCLTQSYLRWRFENELYILCRREVLFVSVLLVPEAVKAVCYFVIFAYSLSYIVGCLAVELLAPRSKLGLYLTLQKLSTAYYGLLRWIKPAVVWAAGEKGIFWYRHIDGELPVNLAWKDPYYPIRTKIVEVEDAGRKLACGDTIKGHPVFCRAGSSVRAGIGQLSRGWKLTTPFSLKTVMHRGELKCMGLTITGFDTTPVPGSIVIMGTPLRSWMGFAYNGCLFTAFHGSRGRPLAGPEGAQPPSVINKAADIVKYPLPKGMKCLDKCNCDSTTGYLATRFGNLIPAVKTADRWLNTSPLTLKEAKGSSGAPLLCKCGKVKGMFVAVRTARGAVCSLKIVDVETSRPSDEVTPNGWNEAYPQVPNKDKEVRNLVAPTGSGKSTKLPMSYYSAGYRVLVLNPSVATTVSMDAYMKAAYNVSPNIRTGDKSIHRASRLTYSTYGMFLTSPKIEADVVICDECHATDPTTVLGIGVALKEFEASQHGKLLILATATPPGTPIQPHENITTYTLEDEGEVDFHGKKLSVDKLRKGRHLIFEATKKSCRELCDVLSTYGITTAYYWRGEPLSNIPTAGDVVVVATDALMTGYTGNFDSVYDCCLSVEAALTVDMNPSISVSVKTGPADSVTRMQRRGRCGRGRPGDYYQVCPASALNGVVSSASVYEAFDSGIAYFGMSPAEVAAALEYYNEQPITSSITVSLNETCQFFCALGYVPANHIERMKTRVDSFVFLHAAQYHLCQQKGACGPSDDPRWRGLTGTNKCPLLYILDKVDLERCEKTDITDRLVAVYEEFYASGLTTFAGVGLAAAAVYIGVDTFGNVVVKRCFELTTDSGASMYSTPDCVDWGGEIEEASLDHLGELAVRASAWLGDHICKLGVHLGGSPNASVLLKESIPYFLSAVQYLAGLVTIGDAPALGAVLAGVGGFLSPLSFKANLFLTALGGAFASKLTSQRGAAVFAVAGAVGASLSVSSLTSAMANIFSVYGSATSSCLVVLKLLTGEMPALSEWVSMGAGLTSPGGTLVGAAAAALVAFATRTENNVWINRLLSMLNRGTTCDDYFVAATTFRQKIIFLLENINLWALFNHLAKWINNPDEELCAPGPRAWLQDAMAAIGTFLRMTVELARAVLLRVASIPGIPYLGCDKPYKGPWVGSGVINSRCSCGAEGIWIVEHGRARAWSVPKKCWAWLNGGVPINCTTSSSAAARPPTWKKMAVNNGFSNYVVYEKRGGEVWVVGATTPDQKIEAITPDLVSAVMVDDAQIKPLAGDGWRKCGPYSILVKRGQNYEKAQIPFKLSDYYTEGGKLVSWDLPRLAMSPKFVHPPAAVQRAVELSSRVCGLEKLVGDAPPKEKRPSSLTEVSTRPKVRVPSVDSELAIELMMSKSEEPQPGPSGVKCAVGAVAPGAEPLPGKPTTYSIVDSSYTDVSEEIVIGDVPCSWSYVWAAKRLAFEMRRRVFSAVSTLTAGMMRERTKAYVTTTDSINERAKKVTIYRDRANLPQLQHQIELAKKRVAGLNKREWSLFEALEATQNKTAKSAVTGFNAPMLKRGYTGVVTQIYDNLINGITEPWNQVNIMPKSEVFVKTAEKPTKKPARIIAYPHLEMRVVEKMVLGEIGPATVKAVCGEAYGFQYTPQQRVARLLEMWRHFQEPMGFTCDTVCFDSTITPEDMEVESTLYQLATENPATRLRIKSLHDNLYKSGPMVIQSKYCGVRQCRASGVFTTSSSNTMTCYLKVNAAANVAGLKNPLWLICGDDCVCISESRGEACDRKALEIFATAMKQMGAPQGEVPKPMYSLELLDSCSSNVSVAQTPRGLYHYLTRSPEIPLARASVEGKGFNPLGTWLGYILANYPAVWVSRILCVQFLLNLLSQDDVDKITFEWYGNNYTIPLQSIPYIIEAIHGKCWDIVQYTPREITRVGKALANNTMKPLRYWKRLGRQALAACRRRRGVLKFLGNTLLSWVHHDPVRLDPSKVKRAKHFNPFDPYCKDLEFSESPDHSRVYVAVSWLLTLTALGMIYAMCYVWLN